VLLAIWALAMDLVTHLGYTRQKLWILSRKQLDPYGGYRGVIVKAIPPGHIRTFSPTASAVSQIIYSYLYAWDLSWMWSTCHLLVSEKQSTYHVDFKHILTSIFRVELILIS
jgi:hypothetical protein